MPTVLSYVRQPHTIWRLNDGLFHFSVDLGTWHMYSHDHNDGLWSLVSRNFQIAAEHPLAQDFCALFGGMPRG